MDTSTALAVTANPSADSEICLDTCKKNATREKPPEPLWLMPKENLTHPPTESFEHQISSVTKCLNF
jgi:hypothetical protein